MTNAVCQSTIRIDKIYFVLNLYRSLGLRIVPPDILFRQLYFFSVSHSKETVITENYIESIYVKRTRRTNESRIMSAVRTISDCAWLPLIDTRNRRFKGFRDQFARGASDFPDDLRKPYRPRGVRCTYSYL